MQSGRREVYQQNRLSYSDERAQGGYGRLVIALRLSNMSYENRLDQGIASELEAKRTEVESLCRRTNVVSLDLFGLSPIRGPDKGIPWPMQMLQEQGSTLLPPSSQTT